MTGNTLLTQIKFIGRVSTMGPRKLVVYIPIEKHEEVLSNFKGKDIKITFEELEL